MNYLFIVTILLLLSAIDAKHCIRVGVNHVAENGTGMYVVNKLVEKWYYYSIVDGGAPKGRRFKSCCDHILVVSDKKKS